MRHELVLYILRVIGASCSTYAVIYLVTSFAAPKFFIRYLSVEWSSRAEKAHTSLHPLELGAYIAGLGSSNRSERMTILSWAKFLPLLVGMFLIVYWAASALVAVVPTGWGGVDDDGQWISGSGALRILIATFGCMFPLIEADTIACARIKGPVDQVAFDAILDVLVRNSTDEQKAAILARVAEVLSHTNELDRDDPTNAYAHRISKLVSYKLVDRESQRGASIL